MTNGRWKIVVSIVAALVMTGAILLGVQASGGPEMWRTTTFGDFAPGTLNGVDIWSAPGNVQLDHQWSDNIKINDPTMLDNARLSLALDFALDTSGPMTKTIFLAVWADERVVDHQPDIYFASSNDGGASWSADTMVNTAHSSDALEEPDIAVRSTDGTFFVVWQNEDDG
ncbi:MAG: hypothetical protein ACP5GX_07025, partial [Anaerolineae bacterium]